MSAVQPVTSRDGSFGSRENVPKLFISAFQENFFDIQEALQAIHMRQEMLREQLAFAKSKGEETVGRNLQVGTSEAGSGTFLRLQA